MNADINALCVFDDFTLMYSRHTGFQFSGVARKAMGDQDVVISECSMKLDRIIEGALRNYAMLMPIPFDEWYGKVFKITAREGDPHLQGFSVITRIHNKSMWDVWTEDSAWIKIARDHINDPGFLKPYIKDKIIECAKSLGLLNISPKKIQGEQ